MLSPMPEFAPCTTLADLETLDTADLASGYWAGFHGAPEPIASVFSRSYQHGWRNGAVDAGRRPMDDDQAALALEFARARSRRPRSALDDAHFGSAVH